MIGTQPVHHVDVPTEIFTRWHSWMSDMAKLSPSAQQLSFRLEGAQAQSFDASPTEISALLAALRAMAENDLDEVDEEEHRPLRFGNLPP